VRRADHGATQVVGVFALVDERHQRGELERGSGLLAF
jgi:hypothetical protein